ncbi:NAD(P)-dependent oxidoreductase [Rhizosaccharibacter radicis]|uniref:precorrin-2 dehydrogenase n=1 Tax=Rhizosaccharibacter radicis TaxID=2782605 RepID=A0ABT1VUJ5_9PROT|nr:SAM-dependent methyltransferase [Acetobacteraceae bacterium KSS12]
MSDRSDRETLEGVALPPQRRPLFPLFLSLYGRPVLLLGSGEAAERRRTTLIACGAVLRESADRFEPAMLDGCVLAVGAGASEDALHALAAEARRRGIPFNVVDRPELSGFLTPAVLSRPPLQVAIASGGAAPVLARLLRARIETLVPPGFGRLAALADRLQGETRRRLPDVLRRRRFLERVLSGRAADLMLSGDEPGAERIYRAALDAAERDARRPETGIAYLVDPGPGEPDLVTLRALRLMGEADVILHGADEFPAILELCRRDAAREAVAAARAVPRMRELLAEGAKLVRLRPSPEEAATLRAGKHDVVTVPGVAGT